MSLRLVLKDQRNQERGTARLGLGQPGRRLAQARQGLGRSLWTRQQSQRLNSHQKVAKYWGIDRGKGWVFCSSEGHIAHKHRW
ncbi:MAG: hypothetical protein WBA10_15420, partial [Elainellaceae cyanobacterium]